MTVSTQIRQVVYRGNSATTVFPYLFPIYEPEHLAVYRYNSVSGARTLVAAAQLSVTGIGPTSSGGAVTFPLTGAPLSADEYLFIFRTVPYTQDADIKNQGGFYPEVIEQQLDLIVMQIQQLAADGDNGLLRALRVPDGETVVDLDRAVDRANKLLGFAADGSPALYTSTPGVSQIATQAEAEAGTSNSTLMTPLRTQQAIEHNAGTILRNLYCMGDSWTYVDSVAPANSYTRRQQEALDTEFGNGTWNVLNYGIGGTAITVDLGGVEKMLTRLDWYVFNKPDVTLVQLQGGINDISNGVNSANIIIGIQAEVAKCVAAGAPFVICTIGPFKGAAFYNGTTRGYVDTVNAWIRTNYGGTNQVIDLWNLYNDPSDDGRFLPAYREDDFHPNNAGKTLWALTFANNPYVANVHSNPIAYSTVNQHFRNTQRDSSVSFNNLIIGQDNGVVRPLTIRSPDRLVDNEQIALIQYNTAESGWFVHADVGGDILFKRLTAAVSLITRLLIAGVATAFSTLTTKWWVQADGVNTRMSGTTYGGGAGFAFQFSVDSATAGTMAAYSAAGAAFGDANFVGKTITISVQTGQNIVLQTGGVNRVVIDGTTGAIWYPSCPYYANRAAATAAMGANRVFYNSTGGFMDLS